MKFCTKCGAPLEPGAFFCTSCGASIDAQQKPAGDPAPQPQVKPQMEYSQGAFRAEEPEQKAFSPVPPSFTTEASGNDVGIMDIYKKAMGVLVKKPVRLWGISLLSGLISFGLSILFGFALGIGIAIGILIDVGMTMVYLHGYRGEQVRAAQLFDGFKDGATVVRVVGGMAWKKLWVFLWFLIPIVGPIFAIIKSYEYRLVPYILVTEPEVRATEAIDISKERTRGWKGRMFGADILIVVIIIAVTIVLNLLAKIPYLGVLFMIINVVVSILISLLSGLFFGLVQAAFYEEISRTL